MVDSPKVHPKLNSRRPCTQTVCSAFPLTCSFSGACLLTFFRKDCGADSIVLFRFADQNVLRLYEFVAEDAEDADLWLKSTMAGTNERFNIQLRVMSACGWTAKAGMCVNTTQRVHSAGVSACLLFLILLKMPVLI